MTLNEMCTVVNSTVRGFPFRLGKLQSVPGK